MTWKFKDTELTGVPEGYEAFVYRITRLSDGAYYYGRKNFFRKVTKPPLKGKVRKRRSRAESDWLAYWSSSEELRASVAELGPDAFRREIIVLCETVAASIYYETKLILETDCLLDPLSLNKWVFCRLNANALGRR